MKSRQSTNRLRPDARAARSLLQLEASASTARALNLVAVWRRYSEEEAYRAHPFFENSILNRCILVKHRLRAHERDLLPEGRTAGTKVILPIDPSALGAGAHSFFIGQRGYEQFLDQLGVTRGSRDDDLLRLLDELPSLDPFLMRERLKKEGFKPARCYFDLSDSDSARMVQFVRGQLAPLIGASYGQADAVAHGRVAKLADKIMADSGDSMLEPLRASLGMGTSEFEEGVFCWKGFLYYKWALNHLSPQIKPVADEIANVRIEGGASQDERNYIAGAQDRIGHAIASVCATVRDTLRIYDDAFAELTRDGKPKAFRDFLLKAPDMFYDLGEQLGGLQHIVSFWRYRFPADARIRMTSEELHDLLADFEVSLGVDRAEAVGHRAA